MHTRREFLKTSAGAAAAAALVNVNALPAAAPLNILVLGGTGFIGPHIVGPAMVRGHKVTIFTRGRRDGNLPAGVTRLVGDRNGQLDALRGKKWDVCIDDSATNLEWVRMSTDLLKGSVDRYLFTSSTGTYYPYLTPNADENVECHAEQADPNDADEGYGVTKRKCELEVLRVFGDRGIVVRPTYIVGPGDTSDRFPYWAARIAQPGEILAPGRKDDPVQWIDVRDLALFYLKLLEDKRSGIYNAVDKSTTIPSREFYETVRKTLKPEAKLVFVDDYDLLEKNNIVEVVPWVLLKGKNLHATSVASSKSAQAGLRTRSLVETLRDTSVWWPTVPLTRREKPRFAITPELEAKVLSAWKSKQG
ncbi:MAG TPA: NAD-dependent epimerase/dehydratase family protein [Gemmatimonadaceae bacterium]|nr:NAD-dependent epimerase/dehydratase family protein [Gemmatimonadaceae bacterium]